MFKHNNYTCGEIICGIPSNSTYSDTRGTKWEKRLHYNTKNYLGGATGADLQGEAFLLLYHYFIAEKFVL